MTRTTGYEAESFAPDRRGGTAGDEELGRLVRRCGRGDQAALAACYERTSSDIYQILRRLTRSPEEADAAMVRTYVALWRRAADFGPADPAVAWIVALAVEAAHA